MGHTSGALPPRNSVGCVRRRLYAIFLFTCGIGGSDPTPVGCVAIRPPRKLPRLVSLRREVARDRMERNVQVSKLLVSKSMFALIA
jgi:hypothetical protein